MAAVLVLASRCPPELDTSRYCAVCFVPLRGSQCRYDPRHTDRSGVASAASLPETANAGGTGMAVPRLAAAAATVAATADLPVAPAGVDNKKETPRQRGRPMATCLRSPASDADSVSTAAS